MHTGTVEGWWEVCGEQEGGRRVGVQGIGDKVEVRTPNQLESKGCTVYAGQYLPTSNIV